MHNSRPDPAFYMKLKPRKVQRAIRMLERMNSEQASISSFESILTPLFQGYVVEAPKYHPGVYVYRARKGEKPKRVEDVYYPPPEKVKSLGRANDVGQSIFYGAVGRPVPFFELDVRPGDHLALSKWKTTGHMMLNHIGFSSESESFENSSREIDSVYEFVVKTKSYGDLNALVYDYIAHKFSRAISREDDHLYKLTIAISRQLLSGEIIDGLLYPTIQMVGNADNIALKARSADRLLEFVSVEYVAIKEVRGMEINIEVLGSATRTDSDGCLVWSGRRLQWELRQPGEQLRVVVENGEYVAYDSLGNRVDPE